MANAILRQPAVGRLVDEAACKGVVCKLSGLPIERCEDCGAHCARCGCSDFMACDEGCEWIVDPKHPDMDLCSACG